jgi:hypothetical protein
MQGSEILVITVMRGKEQQGVRLDNKDDNPVFR